ncbi:MAG: trigger factor [Rhodospirillales bacterium]
MIGTAMDVTETKAEGLKREFKIAVPAAEIEEQLASRLKELANTLTIPGFRPGKAPVSLLRKKYGSSVMGEVLEQTVNNSSMQIMSERSLRPAMQPKVEITSFEEGTDLEYTMAVEVLPDIEPVDFSTIRLERLVAKVDEADVEKALERLSGAYKSSEPVSGGGKSANGDIVVIDFTGTVDGEEFPGGKADGYSLELGSGSFVPGFEEQLVGVAAGDHVAVKVTFPEHYAAAELAGKEAVFDVEVKEVRHTAPASIDDELAKKVGQESLSALKHNIREEHEGQIKELSRLRLKRELLDALAEAHDFKVPEGLLEREFDTIWKQFEAQRAADPDARDEDDAGKNEDAHKADFRAIAERRVRLGLVLSEVGRTNNIHLSQEEINRALMTQVRGNPGHEQAVIDHYRNTPEAMEAITAPLYEDKVVDFMLEMATITEKEASLEDLMRDPEDETVPAAQAGKTSASRKKAARKGKKGT